VYHIGSSEDILSATGSLAGTVVLMLHIDFILETHQIHGYVAFILDLSALADLQAQVDRFLAKIEGGG
jgi:chemotaxis protein CheC